MKKTLAIVLSVLMVVCMMPSMAFAGEEKTDIKDAVVELSKSEFTYTGDEIKPVIKSVKLGQVDITSECDINAPAYSNNVNASTEEAPTTVTVKAKDTSLTYSGETKGSFTINKASFGSVKCEEIYVSTNATNEDVKKEIKLSFNQKSLTNENVIDSYEFPERISAGVNSVKLTAKNDSNFTGDLLVKFHVGIKFDNAYTISVPNTESFIYNGFPQSFSKVDVMKGGTGITVGSFIPRYENNINALNEGSPGCPTLIVEGTGDYVGTLNKEFTIRAFNLASDSGLIVESLGTVAEGSSPKPKVSLTSKSGTKVLQEGIDFTYGYDRTATGKIGIRIEAKSTNFTGTSKYTYYPTGKSIEGAEVFLNSKPASTSLTELNYTYNGVKQEPTVTLKINGVLLSSYYYTAEYSNSVNASTPGNPAKVTITGRNGYAGKIERTYNISKKTISTTYRLAMSSSMTYIPIGDYSYTTNTKYMPDFTLYDTNGKALVRGTDYYVSSYDYTDNYKTAVNLHISGKGNYDGYYYGYKVTLNGVNMAYCRIELSPTTYRYTGYAQRPTVKVYNGSTLVPSTYYIVSYKNNKDIGTATVTVTGINGYTGSQNAYFTITGNTINTCTITLSPTSYKYDGYYKEPVVTVRDGYTTLTKNVDYKLTYANNRAAGTASVTITGIGKYSGTVIKEFTIAGKDNKVTTNYTYYTKYIGSGSFSLGARQIGDGYGFRYTSDDTSVATVSTTGEVSIIGTGKAAIKVETVGTAASYPAYKYVYVTVKPKKPVIKAASTERGKIKVTITKVKGATKYQVNYGRNGRYYNKYITHLENSYTKTSTTIGNRKSGTNYFIKVRAYKTRTDGSKVWGNWTTIRKVRAR